MSNSWKIFILFVIFQTFLQTADFKPPKTRNKDVIFPTISPSDQNKTIERTFKALEGLMDFYQREHKNLIIDGVFGLRVLEGIGKKILADDQRGKIMLPRRLRTRLKKLYSRCKKIAHMSIYYTKKENPHYFEVMGFVAVEPWQSIHPLRNLKLNEKVVPSTANMSKNELKMKESKQDQCIRSLAGDKKKGIKPCTISEYCWKMNTVQGMSGYHLTHQLLFFMMGEAKGCSKVFEAKFKDSYKEGVDKFLSQSCQLMYPEMLRQEKKAIEKKYLDDIDLYMEQCVVCAMLGYAEFFSLHRLNLILGWINPSKGCFGFSDDVKSAPSNEDEDHEEEEEKSDGNKKTMRQLKMAKDLEDGCEVHSTGVGTGLVAHYLRWLLYISRFTTAEVNADGYDKAGFFIKHKYLGVLPSVKTTLMFVMIVILVLIVVAKRLGFRMPKTLWM